MGFAAHRPVETHLEILDEVVEHPQPLGILAIIHICQRPDLGGLPKVSDGSTAAKAHAAPPEARTRRAEGTHLERDVLLVYPHFELLASDNVLLRPCDVVFPGASVSTQMSESPIRLAS
jgi:hypothetical protein